jgi:hypothetical protein
MAEKVAESDSNRYITQGTVRLFTARSATYMYDSTTIELSICLNRSEKASSQ